MAHERLKNATLTQVLSEVAADLGDLLQKELRLARAEVSAKISSKVNASIWMSAAAVLALVAIFILLQAVIFALASYGVAMHWACLMVAGMVALLAAGAFFKGQVCAQEDLTPHRTIHQITRDIETAKEQLT